MSVDWQEYRIEDIAKKTNYAMSTGPFGSAISSKFFQDEGVPVIRGGNLSANVAERMSDEGLVFVSKEKALEFKRSVVRSNDLIFTCWGTINQVGLITDELDYSEYIISNKQMKLTPDPEKADSLFLYYLFSSPIKQTEILSNGIGAAVPGFNLGQLKRHLVYLPPVKEQKRIAGILESLDKKIRQNNKTNQTLEQISQAIFKSWFVDFDPVKAKIAAKQAGASKEVIEQAAMCAISGKTQDQLNQLPPETLQQLKSTAELFPNSLVDSELGKIPKGWVIKTFGDISQCFDSKRIPLSKKKREEKKPGIIPYYGATSVMDHINEWIFDDIFLLLGEDRSVIKEDGTPFVQYIWGKTWVNNHAHVLQGKNNVSTEQLKLFIQSQNMGAYITGAVQLKLNQGNMNSIPFIYAGKEINTAFNDYIKSSFSKIRNAVEENLTLETIRDTLLPKLLSGELEV
jgi:type I restriction enzyme, S subunit